MRTRNPTRLLIVALLLLTPHLCEAASFVAYSLKEAERRLQGDSSARLARDLHSLGGITLIAGLVYDRATDDLIVVGQVDDRHPPITLDDFATVARAVFLHRKYPLVSIDRTPETATTRKQKVVFEGGVENTQLGADMLAADVLLKQIALDRVGAGIWGVESYVTLSAEAAEKSHRKDHISSRFWFIPRRPSLAVREDVFAIMDLDVGVETEVLGSVLNGKALKEASGSRDEAGDRFAQLLERNLADLSRDHPPLARVRPILALVALAEGIRGLGSQVNLEYWVKDYPVPVVETPGEYDLIETTRKLKGVDVSMLLSGGIELNPMVLRLESGDISALREAVLRSRPARDALSWQPPLDGWNIPGARTASSTLTAPSSPGKAAGFSLEKQFLNRGAAAPIPPSSSLHMVPPPRASIPQFNVAGNLPSTRGGNKIGGVMLQEAARITGAERTQISASGGHFSLLVEGENARLSPDQFRKFVTALWAVYFNREAPGVSIDPIAPNVDRHMVRYIGGVVNSDLGRVCREADYLMKKWAVGTEKPDIPKFKGVDDLTAKHGLKILGASRRFWFIPGEMRFKRGGDLLLFESGRMALKTEYLVQNKKGKAEPADEAFATFFTENYQAIADKYPVYRELFDYAKLVSLCQYLKENGVPLLWFLLANQEAVITEDSPGTVQGLARGSKHFTGVEIRGGVDLHPPGKYVFDQDAVRSIAEGMSRVPAQRHTVAARAPEKEALTASLRPGSFRLDDKSYSLVARDSLTAGSDGGGTRYQTDLALKNGKEPGLELVRYHAPGRRSPGDFGDGWHLLIPYEVEAHGTKRIDFLNALIPEKMVLRHLLSGREEILTFSKDRYTIAGYVPDDPKNSGIIGLFLLSDGSFRLADKLGTELQFDASGQLTEMIFSKDFHIKYTYGYQETTSEQMTEAPYRLEPVEGPCEEFYGVRLPRALTVLDLTRGGRETLLFSAQNSLGVAGYVPEEESASRWRILALMADGSFTLMDRSNNRITFDPGGRVECIKTRVVKSMSQGDFRVEFDHAPGNAFPKIVQARLLKEDAKSPLSTVQYEYGENQKLCRVLARRNEAR